MGKGSKRLAARAALIAAVSAGAWTMAGEGFAAHAAVVTLGSGAQLRLPPAARAEIRYRDAWGYPRRAGARRPRGATGVAVAFERGARGCGTVGCGDARAVPGVRWAPALPFVFVIESGWGEVPSAPVRRRGPGDFLRARDGRVYVSNPARLPLPGGRAVARCPRESAYCTVSVPLRPGVSAWFLSDAPADAGGAVLAVTEFADAVLSPARRGSQ